ncbi:MAG: GDP-mannose 4,6-dehydratase [Chloroflexi bacterium]|nr:GDP-mannose 4,6-dehydratase [Chloroflexota bacterium]
MKALVTGATGFVGPYLAGALHAYDEIELHGTCLEDPMSLPDDIVGHFTELHQINIEEDAPVLHLIQKLKPDWVFHLAAQSHVGSSFRSPWPTLHTNIRGTLNILDSMRSLPSSRLLFVSSAEVYGPVGPDDLPLRETHALNPGNPYSVSKAAAELLVRQYHMSYGVDAIIARPFNHIGPGQSERFALADFANQIARIEQGLQPPLLKVGNLAAARDMTDVRDIVRAYVQLLIHGEGGQVYNICRGEGFVLQALVEKLIALSPQKIEIETEQDRLRPLDVPRVVGDASKLQQLTGWQVEIPLDATLRDILEDKRSRLR